MQASKQASKVVVPLVFSLEAHVQCAHVSCFTHILFINLPTWWPGGRASHITEAKLRQFVVAGRQTT